MKSRLKVGAEESYYRSAFAWQDPEGDSSTKEAYKFIHHEVDSDGSVGGANLNGCSAGIAVLNGGRGGANIPDADRGDVWSHLAAHLRDGDREPPELKTREFPEDSKLEIRSIGGIELREKDGPTRIVGYAARYNEMSDPIWFFREQIARGAFSKTISEYDQLAFWSHDPSEVLGRRSTGTLVLKDRAEGLWAEITPPDTEQSRHYLELVRRGDVKGMSFAFEPIRESWEEYSDADNPRVTELRILQEVKLYEVSPVAMPAYPSTSASARGMFPAIEPCSDAVTSLVFKARRGIGLTAAEIDFARRIVEIFGHFDSGPDTDPSAAPADRHPATGDSTPGIPHLLQARIRQAQTLLHIMETRQ